MSRSRPRPGGGGSPLPALPWRVVLDTNVVVSALLFARSPAARVRQAWQSGLLKPLASRDTVAAIVRVLAYPKFRLSPDDQKQLLADYLPAATAVPIPNPPPAVPVCCDVHDLPFLQLTAAGRADALVTGDADFLVLRGWHRPPPHPDAGRTADPSARIALAA